MDKTRILNSGHPSHGLSNLKRLTYEARTNITHYTRNFPKEKNEEKSKKAHEKN